MLQKAATFSFSQAVSWAFRASEAGVSPAISFIGPIVSRCRPNFNRRYYVGSEWVLSLKPGFGPVEIAVGSGDGLPYSDMISKSEDKIGEYDI
jgi:hypothetical protein